jgi:F-type H+-transporting ATPase subunit b
MSVSRTARLLVMFAVLALGARIAFAEDPHAPAQASEAAEKENPNPLVFDPDLAIFSAIVFLILLFVLGKFAWPQISAALDAREKHISDEIAAAEAKNEEAKRLFAEHEAKLAAAASEIRAMLEEARRDAEHTKTGIVAEARKAAQEEQERAVREINRAKEGAVQELAERTATITIELARKVVQEDLTGNRQDALVRDALGKFAATTPSKN